MGMSTLVLGPFIAANPSLVYAVLAEQQEQWATSAVIGGTVNAGGGELRPVGVAMLATPMSKLPKTLKFSSV